MNRIENLPISIDQEAKRGCLPAHNPGAPHPSSSKRGASGIFHNHQSMKRRGGQ